MIVLEFKERDFDYELRALTASFFPKQIFGEGTEKEDILRIYFAFEREYFLIRIQMDAKEQPDSYRVEKRMEVSGEEDFRKHEGKTAHPYRSYYKNQVKNLLYQMLLAIPQERLPDAFEKRIPAWGTMTGVRPTKISMQELLAGKAEHEVFEDLRELYCCSEEKGRLCIGIAKREAELLKKIDYEDGYSLYIGVPFCPTTCLYCSFPSYPVERFGHLMGEYLTALKKEMKAVSEGCRGHRLSSVYIGGGTPTALSPEQLNDLLSEVRSCFPESEACEFTVEAGRPDSISEEKLLVLRKHGICRISVNPQTMQQKTLDLIGRRHTVEDAKNAFLLARKAGFENINMDLIAGLPGETLDDFSDTLEQVKALGPDSITVHSLVIKRASRLREVLEEKEICGADGGKQKLSRENRAFLTEKERMETMEQMLLLAEKALQRSGYFPYYMYRQKNSAGHFGSDGQENIGFAREGKECLYNILIMEEMQTIVALGAGASTKKYRSEEIFFHGKGFRNGIVSRIENVKSVTDYIERIDEMIARKRELFESVGGREGALGKSES